MNAPQNLRQLLEAQALAGPERVFAHFPESGRRLNYGQLLTRSRAVARLLAEQGLEPGDRVALLLPNGYQALSLFIAVQAAGAVALPLSLLAQPGQLAQVLKHSGARLAFVATTLEGRLEAALALAQTPVRVIRVDGDRPEPWQDDAPARWPWPAPQAGDPALLMYTSGTTGHPKGVVLSQANLLAGARFVSEAHALGPTDRVLAVLPLYHINAQVVTALAPLFHGGSLVMPRRFSVQAFWPLALEFGCTWLNLVPTMISYLLADPARVPLEPTDRLRFCRSASAPLPPDQHRAFEARFGIGIIETMGLTETAAPCFSNPLDPALRRVGSPGRPWGNEARIACPDSGRPLPDGQVGEIQVRGPNVMAGYLDAPEESARAFSADGWLRTGDLGYRDPEGYYFVTGRIKELIIKGGENIAPREIDEALLRHPAVLEAAAVGIPDPHYGQDIAAGVVLQADAPCDAGQLLQFCRQQLGAFKTPRTIRILAELPKGPSGKVQRLRLTELFA